MPSLKLFLLGPPRIERDGISVHIPRRKALALLVYLAVTRQMHRRDALAALFWPEHDQSSARAGLRRALSALKDELGAGWLNAEREVVTLNHDAEIELDVHAFRQRLTGCQEHAHSPQALCPTCLSLLSEAAALYRDDFMAGFTLRDSPGFDDWQFFQTQDLRDALAGVLEKLVDGQSARREFERAIVYARRWLALDPLHEAAHRWLIELYAWSGQRAAALRQYKECARILQEELGVSPEQGTVSLHRAVVEHRELPRPGKVGVPTETGAAAPSRHNLPAQVTPFVGRKTLLAQIGQRLADPDCRLLTLVGPGGSGKTRLALEVAARQVDHYPYGVFFVPLAPLDALQAIVPAIAQALGFPLHGEGEPKRQLLNYLSEKSVLLLLDNAEHLICQDSLDVATIAADILTAAPQAKILVTSRAGLHVQGEHHILIEGMDLPPPPSPVSGRETEACPEGRRRDAGQYSAVQLFLHSARRAQRGFALTVENAADVVRICRLVEGMPLGILLAATWAGTLTPAEIAAEIESSLDFLETDWRNVPERQHSMRAVFEHSWTLLTAGQREVMQALSVFRGGFTRGAAERAVGASLRDLTALVDKSLLHRTPGGRYEVHELLRQYTTEKLAACADAEWRIRDQHCAFYVAALQQWDVELKGSRQLTALTEIEAEIGNARAAWEWALRREQLQDLDRAMDGLCRFYEWRGRYEEGDAACRAVARALDAQIDVGASPPLADGRLRLWAKATSWRGAFNRALCRLEQAKHLLEESLSCLERLASAGQEVRQEKAFVLWQLGYTLYNLGDREARQRYEGSQALYRALGDRWGQASVSYHLGDWLCVSSGTPHEAEPLVRESLAIQRELGDHRGMAASLRVLSVITIHTSRLGESERLAQESVATFRAMGDRAHTAEALLNWGSALIYLGRLAEARSRMEESVTIYRDLGFSGSSSSLSLSFLDLVDMLLGRYDEAGARAQEALALAQEGGYRLGIGFARLALGMLAIAKADYAEAQQILPQAGSENELVVGKLLVLPYSGYAARGLGQPDRARQYYGEALRLASEMGEFATPLRVLPGIALLLADEGEVERAVELYALASRYPYVSNAQWFEDVAGKQIAAAAATLPPGVVAAIRERGRARDLETTVKELLVELQAERQDQDCTAAS